MLKYTTKKIEDEISRIKNEVDGVSDYAQSILSEDLENFKEDKDYLAKYYKLIHAYRTCAFNYLIARGDNIQFKGYCYLASKAAQMCLELYDKGLRRPKPDCYKCSINNLVSRENIFFYAHFAILSNSNDLALCIALPDSLLGSILLEDYDRARRLLPKDLKKISKYNFEEQIFWTIVYSDEKKMNKIIMDDIKTLRWQAKFDVGNTVCLSSWGLALIKLARRRGMVCNLDVIELPQHLLDDEPINEEEWKLPEDEGMEVY